MGGTYMESKNIIIILIVIIVILAAAIGFMVLKPMHAKEPTKIKVDSNKTLYEGDNLSVKLTDLNKTPLSKQKVNITIKNSKGKVVINKTVKTNSKGKAKLDLDLKKGKYDVQVTYSGNENYTGNNTTQKLTIKEKVVEAASETTQTANANEQEQIDYNSPNSNYFKSEDGSGYHEKQDGVKYVYAQDARTGEWSYWLDKS